MDKILWKPDNNQKTHFNHFIDLVNSKYDLDLKTYNDLYDWSVNNIPQFWENTLDYSDIVYSGTYDRVIDNLKMEPGVKWFPGISLNFAENLLKYRDDKTAIISKIENHPLRKITYRQLFTEVEKLAASLRNLGVTRGDRVAGFLPNIPESIIAMLATASIGAIWSSSSPDFGIKSVTDRFSQIKPKIIFSASAYLYKGKSFSSIEKLQEIIKQLPTIQTVVIIDYLNTGPDYSKIPNSIENQTLQSNDQDPICFEKEPFEKSGLEFIKGYENRRYDAKLYPQAISLLTELRDMGISHSILSAQHHSLLYDLTDYYKIRDQFIGIIGLDNHLSLIHI